MGITCTLYILLGNLIHFSIPVIQGAASNQSAPEEETTKGLLALLLIIFIPAIIALVFLFRFVYKHTIGKKLQTTLAEDYRREAEEYERSGKFVSAANVHEKKLRDYRKAASLYEKGKDYNQAALLYDHLGMSDKAKEMYEKAGTPEDAAEVALLDGEFEEAARFYDMAGKKTDVAKVMEQAGNTLYAVKAYREAGKYKKAAMLLEGEGMYKEAAEMFGFHLHDKAPEKSNIEDFYTYAILAEKSGDVRKAIDILREIGLIDPAFKDVKRRLEALTPPFKEEEIPAGRIALRSFIKNGPIQAKYSLKLWVQMLKSLQESYVDGWPYGLLSPDSVAVDAQNKISFFKRKPLQAYVPPETVRRLDLDVRADIYSAGVILYEMLTGNLDGVGSVRVTDIVGDVPEWLDEIVIKCLKKVREDRYQSIQEIFSDLKKLSQGKTSLEKALE